MPDKNIKWFVFTFTFGWIAFHTAILKIYFNQTWEIALWDAAVFTFCTAIASISITNLLRFFPRAGLVQLSVIVCLILAWLTELTSHQALQSLFSKESDYLVFLESAKPIRWSVALLWIAATIMIGNLTQQLKEIKTETVIHQSTEVMVREAELQKLQIQLQPHFLFNSLNSINALIITQPEKASDMVQQLSDFLRATIKRADEKWITIAQEFDYLRLYLSIEQVRFGHRLKVNLEIDEQISLWLIPPLLLQPLVENAIKFGLYGTTGEVSIMLKTFRDGDNLMVHIENPFDEDMKPAEGSGFGLNGLKRRLYLLYARNDLLQTQIDNKIFKVTLTLPEKYD